jgi:serine protease Do
MTVLTYGSLAAALLAAAGAGIPLHAAPQEYRPLMQTMEIAGRGARIGVSVTEIEGEDAKAPKGGVLVETVTPGGPADKAGIKAGDAITEFDGERVRSVTQFSRLVMETTPGHSVAATLSRGGQRVTVTVTPERRNWSDDFEMRLLDVPRAARIPAPPAPPAMPRTLRPFDRDDFPGVLRLWNTHGLGVTIESLDDQLAQYFGVKEGVLVKSVVEDSPAQKAGVKAGDVITAINGSHINDTSDVNRAVDRVETNGDFSIEIMRDKKPQVLKGKLEPGQARRRGARAVTMR